MKFSENNHSYFHLEKRLTIEVQAVTIICVKMHKESVFLFKKGTGSKPIF
ncbi:hypothetical protein [Leuconostoc rapi]|nr:hypothetical protein [Leuconostoc rapi]MBM7435484.1 hypothetical protein [Leuconostoc rapi]